MANSREPRTHDNLDGIVMANRDLSMGISIPRKSCHSGLLPWTMMHYRTYTFIAYPGPEMVDRGRAEHLPLHFHVKYAERSGQGEIRIRTEDFREYEGLEIPKAVRDIIKNPKVRAYLIDNTKSIFETGKKAETKKPNVNNL